MRIAAIILTVLTICLISAACLLAEDLVVTAPTPAIFVDRDGDGFNDAALDQNSDGIPDDIKGDNTPAADNTLTSAFAFTTPMSTGTRFPVFLHNSLAFDFLKSQLCGLAQHRGAFSTSADFGPGCDIGSGAVLGGGCIGGVCTPR